MLALQKYSFTLIHKPGKEIPVADTLSRKSMDDEDSSLFEAMETLYTVIDVASVSADRMNDIRTATTRRPTVYSQAGHLVRLAGDQKKVSPTCQ